jgi:hypothetical protein
MQEMKLSKIYKIAATTAMAVSAVTLMAMIGPGSAATLAPQRASTNYCLSYSRGGTDCSFTSKAQCEATASGQAAECYRNVYGKEGEFLRW